MNRLKRRIVDRINAEGPISFKSYMSMCLYDENHGYYRSPDRLGREGDFFTAAHLGTIIGRVLGHRLIDVAPPEGLLNVVEMGAGQGLIAMDLLEYVARNHAEQYKRLRYHFVEQNPAMREQNRSRLKDHLDRVLFHETLNELPEMLWGFVFSNEFFDAFPVHLVSSRSDGLGELHVGYNEPHYVEVYESISPEVERELKVLNVQVPDGCTIEINSDIEPVYRTLSKRIERLHMITIDYGYTQDILYHPDRSRGDTDGIPPACCLR